MKRIPYQLNQFHWKYTARITNGFNEERIYEDSDDEFYEEAFDGDEFDEFYEDEISIKEMKLVA
ncbi:hypothetical protein [Emticicia agri]|uniref:Uncharacterized protein n=1 Tax=Emticicia agri TaxID=2492393 RepID=A0A4Q5M2R7_9BACT|nr:hypothetical protein [Emticicia agri]RYU96581.1 hypothetical protein EWM59_05370 [Emticicia agri]